jgi:hypothetical protein
MSLEMEAQNPKLEMPSISHKMDFEPAFTTFKKKDAPIKLVWKDIEYSVNGNGPKKKTILKKISGEASPGEVVALMGVRYFSTVKICQLCGWTNAVPPAVWIREDNPTECARWKNYWWTWR